MYIAEGRTYIGMPCMHLHKIEFLQVTQCHSRFLIGNREQIVNLISIKFRISDTGRSWLINSSCCIINIIVKHS